MRTWVKHSPIAICLALLVICVSISCQPSSRCCELAYGLLQTTDLDGNWKLIDESLQLLQPSGEYKIPAVEFRRQLLSGAHEGSADLYIVHDLRRYDPLAPQLSELKFRTNSFTPSGPLFDPGVIDAGQFSQTQCQIADISKPDSFSVNCVTEVRYSHIISTIYFYFDISTLSADMKTLINQALSKTDERVQKIDQHLSEVSN